MRIKRRIESLIKAAGLVMLVYGVLIFSPAPKSPPDNLGCVAWLVASLKADGWLLGAALLFTLPVAILLGEPDPVWPRGWWRQIPRARWVAAGCVFSGLFIATVESTLPHDSLGETLLSLALAVGIADIGISKWLTELYTAASKKSVPAESA